MINSSSDKTLPPAQSNSFFKKIQGNLTRKKVILLFIIFSIVFAFFKPEIAQAMLEKVWWLIY